MNQRQKLCKILHNRRLLHWCNRFYSSWLRQKLQRRVWFKFHWNQWDFQLYQCVCWKFQWNIEPANKTQSNYYIKESCWERSISIWKATRNDTIITSTKRWLRRGRRNKRRRLMLITNCLFIYSYKKIFVWSSYIV